MFTSTYLKMNNIRLEALCLVIILFCELSFVQAAQQCHARLENWHQFLATKTPYRYIANRDDSPPNYPGCTAVKMWAMIRHGTRNPSEKVIRKMNDRLPVLRDAIIENHRNHKGLLCDHEVELLSRWHSHVEEADEKRLTHEGEDELLELGERFQKRFPHLLPEIYLNTSFKFQYTATQRAKESARHFAIGLFGRKVSRYVWFPEAISKDPVLRFYKLCERWRKDVDKNPASLTERRSFESGPEVMVMLEKLSKRLGFADILDLDSTHLMYLTCAFETAWNHHHPSPWCSVFDIEDFQVLEYAEDLEYYWTDGFGFEINYQQACPTLKDMFSLFRNPNNSSLPQSVLYFSHAGTILKMLAHLGVYHDKVPLLASNFHSMLENRQWQVSRIGSFASNIAFIHYKCGSVDNVLTLHQERPVTLSGCPESQDLCPMDTLLTSFKSSVEECNFSEMCAWKPSSVPGA